MNMQREPRSELAVRHRHTHVNVSHNDGRRLPMNHEWFSPQDKQATWKPPARGSLALVWFTLGQRAPLHVKNFCSC